MKYLALIIFMLPLQLFSQEITGLWTGTLHNDTTKQTIHYEIAITEIKGKYTGYSYTTFIVDNQKLVGVKSIKVFKKDGRFFLEDDQLLYNNYPFDPPKGVKQVSSISFEAPGNGDLLSGKFITTRTRQYGKQVTGQVKLERKKEYKEDKLITRLDQLNLLERLSFLPKKTSIDNVSVSIEKDKSDEIKPSEAPEPEPKPAPPAINPIPNPLTEIEKRRIETIETFFFSGDSLLLALYDNGFVDGDSVSLIVNGELLLQHLLLSTQAIIQAIQTPRGVVDSLNIIMYAENLGSIPPNSGLLVIFDGEDRYEVNFSGDLQKNASVLLKRKR